ncbi:MAG: hypothetical protein J2P41_04905 [Blastocatellia bacterium]|nr:hypothetical protein [Blastocatellia bacterium]
MISRISLLAVFIAVTIFGSGKQKDSLIVHEWGTFTTVSRADGTAYHWNPLLGPSELPVFVHGASNAREGNCPKCASTLARMETPVLYFYTNREMKVSVKVDFPSGKITEWFPQASSTNPGINWESVTVLPGSMTELPNDGKKSHYYPARDTDASTIQVETGTGNEREKFLFYRGIGDFLPPLQARLAGDRLILKNTGSDEISPVILFENRQGKMGWEVLDTLTSQADLPRPALGRSIDSLDCELQKALAAHGLFEKEADAMVKTWRDSWFEEGMRVFYIVPRKATDAILPIAITPLPDQLARVFVGRGEIITPEIAGEIQDAARKFREGSSEERFTAIKMVRRYGRFAEPVLREMMTRDNNPSLWPSIWNLVTAAR